MKRRYVRPDPNQNMKRTRREVRRLSGRLFLNIAFG